MNLDTTYNDILEDLYEEFSQHYPTTLSFEDWRCKVDVHYRQTYGIFPKEGKNLPNTLKVAAIEVGKKLIFELEEEMEKAEREQHIESSSEKLVQQIEAFLRHKRRRHKLDFPFSQRFTRGDVWTLERDVFEEEACDRCEGFDPAFERLTEEGVFRLVERGCDPPHDVFQLVDV